MIRSVARWIGLVVLPAALPGQDARIRSCLPAAAEQRVREVIAERLPELRIEMHRTTSNELLASVLRGASGIDVVLGIDGLHAYELAQRGLLARYEAPGMLGMSARYRGPDDRFAVPWTSALVIAVNRETWSPETEPKEFDDLLFDPAFFEADHIVLSVPEAQPALWVGWMQSLKRRHDFGEEQALAWLRKLDARVSGYEPSVESVLSSLTDGRGSISVLAVADVHRIGFGYVVPRYGAPVQGYAVGILEGQDAPSVRELFDLLVSADLAYEMAKLHFVPALRSDLNQAALPDVMRDELMPAMLPYDYRQEDMAGWFARWHEKVRGTGATLEWLDLAFDGVFALVFIVFLYFVHRSMSQEKS